MTAATSTDIVFQLTGLLLIVPSKAQGGQTHVLMPWVDTDPHEARIAFGADSTEVCLRYVQGICHVNLEEWEMAPIGVGGAPTDPDSIRIPAEVVNVTRLPGGSHKVDVPSVHDSVKAHVIFAAGGVRDAPCSLARWTYRPFNGAGQEGSPETQAFANVVRWTIRHAGNQEFKLRFVKKPEGTPTVEIPLRAVANGQIHVVLAYLPSGEADASLPPATPEPAPEPTGSVRLEHLHDFYDLLRHRTSGKPLEMTRRPIPELAQTIPPRLCEVTITAAPTARDTVAILPHKPAGTKTYACVVGTAEG